MWYPMEMTADEIAEVQYELNRLIDMERNEGQYWAENAELQVAAQEQQDKIMVDFIVG